MKKATQEAITNIGFVLLLAFGAFQIYAGYIGLHLHLSAFWTVVIIVLSFVLRFPIAITVGALYAATDIWGWHWSLATLFAASGLVFIIPALILPTIETIKR